MTSSLGGSDSSLLVSLLVFPRSSLLGDLKAGVSVASGAFSVLSESESIGLDSFCSSLGRDFFSTLSISCSLVFLISGSFGSFLLGPSSFAFSFLEEDVLASGSGSVLLFPRRLSSSSSSELDFLDLISISTWPLRLTSLFPLFILGVKIFLKIAAAALLGFGLVGEPSDSSLVRTSGKPLPYSKNSSRCSLYTW